VAAYIVQRLHSPEDFIRQLKGFLLTPNTAPVAALFAVAVILMIVGLPAGGLIATVLGMGLMRWQTAGPVNAIGAYDNDRLIGGIRLRYQRHKRTLSAVGMYVEPEYRRHGIGRQLMLEANRQAEANRDIRWFVIFSPVHPATRRLTTLVGVRLTLHSDASVQVQRSLAGK
jgi:GNAT superfamily N-acetyltransferase